MKAKFIIFIFIFSSFLFSQNEILKFDKEVYDFGTLNQMQTVSVIFYYTNVSDKVVTIKNIHSSCGCTVPEISKKTLRPKEFGEVKVVFNSGRFMGNVQKTVFFEIEPTPTSDSPKIMIRAKIIPDLYLIPESVFLNNVKRGSIEEREVKVLSSKWTNFKIKNISYNTEYFKVNIANYKENNSKGYLLKIKIFTEKIKTSYFMEILKIYTDISSSPEQELAIHGYIH